MTLLRFLRRLVCSHAVYYDTDMQPRDASGNVKAKCYKCGKLLVADCGLNLNAELRRSPPPKIPR